MGGVDDGASPPLKRLKLMSSSVEGTSSSIIPPQESFSVSSMPTACISVKDKEDGSDAAVVGSMGLIRRSELVRIITQSLYALGYKKTASLLEDESGLLLHSPLVTIFRQQILDGKWDDAIANMKLLLPDPHNFNMAASHVLEQKFFELLDKQETMEALKTLRFEISPLHVEKKRLHELAIPLICATSVESVWVNGNEKKLGGNSRQRLLQRLQSIFSPSVMVPDRRLEHLLEQALVVQRNSCIYHNSVEQPLSLYSEHRCGHDQIPNETLQILHGHENEVWFLQFSHNGKYLASASKDGTTIIWEVVDEDFVECKHTLAGHQKPVSFIAWSPNDEMVLTCGNEEVIKLWLVASGECKHTFDKPRSKYTTCAWLPDGQRFMACSGDKCMYVWDVEGKEGVSWMGRGAARVNDLTITPDGGTMICVCEKDIRIYNMELKAECVIQGDHSITSLSVSKCGRFLLVNLLNHEVHLRDILHGWKFLLKYTGHRQSRYAIRSCFGGFDQAFVVSGSEDSQVYLWHRGNGEILEVLMGHSGTVNCVSWNPANPHMFASASDDHTVRIWGVAKHLQNPKVVAGTSNSAGHAANGFPPSDKPAP